MPILHKFQSLNGDEWCPHRYPNVFAREKTTGPDRLAIAVAEGGADTLLQLTTILGEPFALLYVLLVARSGSEPGRYQSPWMNRTDLAELFEQFGEFWDQDGRHHLWLFSKPERATLVYDQHNVIFAYGPLDDYIRLLESAGFIEVPHLGFPAPHRHLYHLDFDSHERDLLARADWTRTPLRPSDDP